VLLRAGDLNKKIDAITARVTTPTATNTAIRCRDCGGAVTIVWGVLSSTKTVVFGSSLSSGGCVVGLAVIARGAVTTVRSLSFARGFVTTVCSLSALLEVDAVTGGTINVVGSDSDVRAQRQPSASRNSEIDCKRPSGRTANARFTASMYVVEYKADAESSNALSESPMMRVTACGGGVPIAKK
jgi:hypothetical protein